MEILKNWEKFTKKMKNDEFSTFDELVLEKKKLFFIFFLHMLVMSIGLVHVW